MRYLLFLTTLFYTSCSNKAALALQDAEIQQYQLSNVDTLLDIGCGDADFDMEISKNHPQLHFVLEDLEVLKYYRKKGTQIIQEYSTADRVQKTIAFHCKEFPGAQNKFKLVIGSEDSLPLPSESFDRVLCRNSLHEFSHKEKMVSEITRVMRQNGRLTIVEALSTHSGQRNRNCGKPYFTKEEIISLLAPLRFTGESVMGGNKSRKMYILNFVK